MAKKWFEKDFALWPQDRETIIRYVNELLADYLKLKDENIKLKERLAMTTIKTEEKGGFKVISLDMGKTVICDWSCAKDWTDREESGGLLFQSKAVCPECMPKLLEGVKKHGEEKFIREYCPKGVSFANWVRSMREDREE